MNTLYGVPSGLVTRPGATAYGEPVRTSSRPSLGQRLLDGLVAGAPVGPEVRGDVHLRRVDGGGDARHDVGRVAADDEQPPAEALVELAQAAVEHGAPGRARRAEQRRVEHEQREAARGRPSAAARNVGWSCTRRSRRNQTTAVPSGAGSSTALMPRR